MDGNDGKRAPGARRAEAEPGGSREGHPEGPDAPADGETVRAPRDHPDEPAPTSPGWEENHDTTIVLGGAAAEAAGTPAHGVPIVPGRSGGQSPGGRSVERAGAGREPAVGSRPDGPPAGASGRPGHDADEPAGRHFRRADAPSDRRRTVAMAAAAVPLAALILLVVGWAIDTAALSGQVMRNVEIAGQPVGGLGEDSLPEVMARIADEVATRPVAIVSGDSTYETTAGEIGLAVDETRTADDALDTGRDEAVFVRPFSWLHSFFSHREVPVRYTVSESDVTTELLELQGSDVQVPADPSIELTDQGFVLVPGSPGMGVDAEEVARELPAAAAQTPEGTIEVVADRAEFAPRFSDEEAQQLADRANQMTANGLVIRAGDQAETEVEAQQLRSWLGPTTDDGEMAMAIDGEAVTATLPELFPDISSEPRDARITLEGGTPVIISSRDGVRCCGDDSPQRILRALREGAAEVTLEVEVTEPALTTGQAEELGIQEPVGGNHAWRDGAPTSAGPGFTTYHAPGQARVTNIHRIAELVRGAVVRPGESFSINEHVGERTAAKGFVPAGAILDGEYVDEVGGGVSQFATTLFNAAYFAGLDITTYQAHSEYFSRYPRGREATMGHPAPDLVIRNNTPYGILIWTSYTDTSLTVTLYSTPYATAEQTGTTESEAGNCTVVTTTRTRTYPDGHTDTDTFRATYRPGEGEFC